MWRLDAWAIQSPDIVKGFRIAVEEAVESGGQARRTTLFYLEAMAEYQRDYKWTPQVQAKFILLRNAVQVQDQHIHEVARLLFRSKNAAISRVALLLMQCCSQDGYLNASLDLCVATASRGPSRPRTVLADNDVSRLATTKLEHFSESGNVLAATMLAELASRQGKRHGMVRLWDHAVQLAAEQNDLLMQTPIAARFEHLRKPWVHAAELLQTVDPAKSRQYLRVGMQLDDADAYASYAIQHEPDSTDDVVTLLEWLNAATKAAASGSVQSCMALAHFYANTAAPDQSEMIGPDVSDVPLYRRYLEQAELTYLRLLSPEKYKERSREIEERKLDSKARSNIAKHSRGENDLTDYQISVAKFDAACRTPEDRAQMSIQWLELAFEYRNVSAALDLAKLHSRRYLFEELNMNIPLRSPDKQTDGDILEVAKEHPEVYGTNPRLKESWNYKSEDSPPMEDDQGNRIVRRGTENPYYNLKKVQEYLNAVSSCRIAIEHVKKSDAKTWQAKRDIEQEWYLFPDVAQYNELVIDVAWKDAMDVAATLGVDVST
ncbi:Hypothetical protein D9617_7g031310 [Elsinoe fawcettii]|nr:Hypothetical protein D9617_7g031310 [Elsinoe fawcettii]